MKITFCCKQMREMWQENFIRVALESNRWFIVVNCNTNVRDLEKYKIRFCPFCKAKMIVRQHTWKFF